MRRKAQGPDEQHPQLKCTSSIKAETTLNTKAVKIPHDQLSREALLGLIEEFVTRDGTDYGETEVPLETKIQQVLNQLTDRKAVIVFDPESGTTTILRSTDPALRNL
ncbi:MAG TPA: cytoplasmic protein [Desulfobacteraceae bacterium]|mgnify:CR=1 FL=1|nr:cytoplasmic protein [Desulfobacteraceae bacterium]|tara:strand:+ start:465 stop:785 length:321 start_codon:yes stop_codon:yes gene_type:complete